MLDEARRSQHRGPATQLTVADLLARHGRELGDPTRRMPRRHARPEEPETVVLAAHPTRVRLPHLRPVEHHAPVADSLAEASTVTFPRFQSDLEPTQSRALPRPAAPTPADSDDSDKSDDQELYVGELLSREGRGGRPDRGAFPLSKVLGIAAGVVVLCGAVGFSVTQLVGTTPEGQQPPASVQFDARMVDGAIAPDQVNRVAETGAAGPAAGGADTADPAADDTTAPSGSGTAPGSNTHR